MNIEISHHNIYDVHMEKTQIKVENNVKNDAIRNYRLFQWVLVDEVNDLKETTLTFERDNEVPYYKDLVRLENQFNKVYSLPSWLSYVFTVVALIYVSIMAILYLTHVITLDKSLVAIIIAIPGGVLLLLNVLVSFIRNKQMNHHLTRKEEKYQKYQEKVNQLINK